MRKRCPKCNGYDTSNPRQRRVVTSVVLAALGLLVLLLSLRSVLAHFGFLIGGGVLTISGIVVFIIGIRSRRGYCRQCDLRFDPDTVEPRPLDRLL